MAFSPDGKLLATAETDDTVRRWVLATRQAIGAPLPADPGGGVNGVTFRPDGKLLATAYDDGVVRLWNSATGQAAGTPSSGCHRRRRDRGGVHPDGKLLAAADGDGSVRLWNTATGQAAGAPHPADPGAACTGWRSARTASSWPPPTTTGMCGCGTRPPGRPPGLPSRPVPARVAAVHGVAFSPDGKLLATADADGTVRTWPATAFRRPVRSALYRCRAADKGRLDALRPR